MKIKEGNAGLIINFELLHLLNSRGAAKDTTRVMASVGRSEYKVYDYLVGTVACNQTKEHINEFLEKSQKFKLTKAEILSIINTRPSQLVELDPIMCRQIVEQQEQRPELDMEELLELILQVLPPPPSETEPEPEPEPVDEDNNKTADAEKNVPDE
ncbi:unnamed protein product [Linum tenue]|uniref:DNA-directed RNA polymerase III subunit RPC9 n=1 Tax=Linum tenue TaxID=586396 RepID=A0AAV0P6X7_9ROSI|nr:unnamed protein product [Linum tenue]